jgi:RimJ/RimL family protein N-acetyltransferase
MKVLLRVLEDADLDQLFEWERDPEAVAMAAFTRADPSDRVAFDDHHRRIRADPDATLLAIEDDSGFAGVIGSFTMEGKREITYWIDPARWGRGIASAALDAFLRVEATRPLFARVAEHNIGSAKVLTRAGFAQIGSDSGYAQGVGREVVEHIYRLVGGSTE